jgi:uncharacterized membrane protein
MLPVIFLSLCAAIAYGLSDFVGGVASRRASVWAVAVASQGTAALMTIVLAFGDSAAVDGRAVLTGAVGGFGSAAGNVYIYRGLAAGRMAVVAPLSAIAAATLPTIVGLLLGDRLSVWPLSGVALALPAIWLVAGGGGGFHGASRRDLFNGLAAGLGFGVQFSALGLVPPSAGLTPLAISQLVSVSAIILAAVAQAAPWLPRDRVSNLGVVAGVLAGVATICFQRAVQNGMLTIAGVLTSLYPAVTVLLAATVLREPILGPQRIGLTLAAAAVALIASG